MSHYRKTQKGCSVLFCSVLFCSVLFCSVLFCSVLFCSVLFCSVKIVSLSGMAVNPLFSIFFTVVSNDTHTYSELLYHTDYYNSITVLGVFLKKILFFLFFSKNPTTNNCQPLFYYLSETFPTH